MPYMETTETTVTREYRFPLDEFKVLLGVPKEFEVHDGTLDIWDDQVLFTATEFDEYVTTPHSWRETFAKLDEEMSEPGASLSNWVTGF